MHVLSGVCESTAFWSDCLCLCFSAEHVFASLPQMERGVAKVLGGDPKGNNFLYTNGKSVIIRNIDVSITTSICFYVYCDAADIFTRVDCVDSLRSWRFFSFSEPCDRRHLHWTSSSGHRSEIRPQWILHRVGRWVSVTPAVLLQCCAVFERLLLLQMCRGKSGSGTRRRRSICWSMSISHSEGRSRTSPGPKTARESPWWGRAERSEWPTPLTGFGF